MAEVSKVSGVEIASIEAISGVNESNIDAIDGVDFVTGFTNTYSLKQTVSPHGGYVSIANPSSYHFESSRNDQAFSLSLWVKPTYGTNFWCITKGATGGSANREIFFGVWSSGVVTWWLSGNSSATQYLMQYDGVNRSSTLADGNWHHLAASYDGSATDAGLTWYLDGTAYTTGRSSSGYSYLYNSGEAVRIGGWDGNSNTFIGYIDEVSIWNTELTGAEVTSIYNSGTPTDLSTHGAVASLLSWWRMGDNNGGTGTTVTDVQSVGDGTLNSFQSGDGFNASVP